MAVYIQGVSDEIKKSLLTVIGDMIAASAVGTPARLAGGALGIPLLGQGAGVAPAFSGAIAPTTIAATDATDATSPTAGALKTAGGLAVAKAAWIGGLLNVAGQVTQGGPITSANIKRALISKTGIADNVATAIFTITQATGQGGGYVCKMYALVGHNTGDQGVNKAVKTHITSFARAQLSTTGVTGAVDVTLTGTSAAINAADKDIGTITVTVAETSEYVLAISYQIDLTGTGVATAEVYVLVETIATPDMALVIAAA